MSPKIPKQKGHYTQWEKYGLVTIASSVAYEDLMDFQSVLVKSAVLATGTSEVVSRSFGRSFKGFPLICMSSVLTCFKLCLFKAALGGFCSSEKRSIPWFVRADRDRQRYIIMWYSAFWRWSHLLVRGKWHSSHSFPEGTSVDKDDEMGRNWRQLEASQQFLVNQRVRCSDSSLKHRHIYIYME